MLNVLELKPGLWDNPEGRGITPVAEPCRYMVETNNIVIILQLKIIFFLPCNKTFINILDRFSCY